MDEARFYSKDLRHVEIQENDSLLKVKLAFFYIRSIENIGIVQYYILNQISQININNLHKETFLILFKTLFNLIKNNISKRDSEIYQTSKEYLQGMINSNFPWVENLKQKLNMSQCEAELFDSIFS